MESIKVLLVDDHTAFRDVVREFLDRLPNVSVVGEASSGDEAVRKAESLEPDLVLMDVAMPAMNGLEATRVIKSRWPGIKVFIATMYDDAQYRLEAQRSKADGYFIKSSLKKHLEAALNAFPDSGRVHTRPMAKHKVHQAE
ncbi:MAG: response regulator transcription factor [Bacteroidota bacterium]